MRAKTTLLALTCAAAFGGFAATAIRDVVQQPAGATPGAVAAVPFGASVPVGPALIAGVGFVRVQ